uniref:Uncharacterized protein n=1 Tax=Anguilla anguilla TaxID=7936 RepID=A0A0E9RQQ4_ANGAN
MWLSQEGASQQGSSDFFTLLFRACRKHWRSRASICSCGDLLSSSSTSSSPHS